MQEIDQLFDVQKLLLNDRKLSQISYLEMMENLQILHLQRNYISSLEGLSYCRNLTVLNLNCNKIKKIENINQLTNLSFLDLSMNELEHIDFAQIPCKKLIVASFYNNPCNLEEIQLIEYLVSALENLVNIERLDGRNVNIRDTLLFNKDIKTFKSREAVTVLKYYERLLLDTSVLAESLTPNKSNLDETLASSAQSEEAFLDETEKVKEIIKNRSVQRLNEYIAGYEERHSDFKKMLCKINVKHRTREDFMKKQVKEVTERLDKVTLEEMKKLAVVQEEVEE